jgi:hypothetical protein
MKNQEADCPVNFKDLLIWRNALEIRRLSDLPSTRHVTEASRLPINPLHPRNGPATMPDA